MIAIFDIDELNHLYKNYNSINNLIDLPIFAKIVLQQDNDDYDRYQNKQLWEIIETSDHFDDEFFMSKVTDNYLIGLETMMESFTFDLINYVNDKMKTDLSLFKVADVNIHNSNLILTLNKNE